MARLKSRHHFPPHGWKFYQPQTRWELPGNLSFNGAVLEIINHRAKNVGLSKQHRLSTDYTAVSDELDSFNAARCISSGWRHFVVEEQAATGLPLSARLNGGQGNADVVQLRRNGDILCIMPILLRTSHELGRPIRLVVHRDFAPLLDGVSYVTSVPWDGDWEDPIGASRALGGVNAQVFGRGLRPDTVKGNFAKLAWKQLGYEWNRHPPLLLDRRSKSREEQLAASLFKTQKPKLLVKMNGHSSPFHDAEGIRHQLQVDWADRMEVVNLDGVQAERLYDLCGLMDRAACLVSVDTSTVWLAHASKVPLVQFTNGTRFGASPPRGNCIFRTPYHEIRIHWPTIHRLIETTLLPDGGQGMVLVFSDFQPLDQDAQRRQSQAYETWLQFPAQRLPFAAKRNSHGIGDGRGMPFVRDMIEAAFQTGQDICVITNNDIRFDPVLAGDILRSCAEFGCWWAYRTERSGGPTDQGADVFAFTRKWWTIHQHLFPDFLLGYWWWDDVMVRLMRWSGCLERSRLYYHEPHHGTESPTRQNTQGAKHNERLANEWLKLHDEDNKKP